MLASRGARQFAFAAKPKLEIEGLFKAGCGRSWWVSRPAASARSRSYKHFLRSGRSAHGRLKNEPLYCPTQTPWPNTEFTYAQRTLER